MEESDLLFLLLSLILFRLSALLLPPLLTLDSTLGLDLDVCSFDGLREGVRLPDLGRLAGGGAVSSESEALDEEGGGEAGRDRREGTERAMLGS